MLVSFSQKIWRFGTVKGLRLKCLRLAWTFSYSITVGYAKYL